MEIWGFVDSGWIRRVVKGQLVHAALIFRQYPFVKHRVDSHTVSPIQHGSNELENLKLLWITMCQIEELQEVICH